MHPYRKEVRKTRNAKHSEMCEGYGKGGYASTNMPEWHATKPDKLDRYERERRDEAYEKHLADTKEAVDQEFGH